MSQPVVIKGTKSGIILVLDQEMDFEELKEWVAKKFKSSSDFLGDASLAISFEGRVMTTEEQEQIIDVIHDNSQLHIVCIAIDDPEKEAVFQKSVEDRLMELSANTGQFYKGSLRSGQVIEAESSIIVIGDVKPGAKVVSKGNIIVLGALRGTAFAGCTGNDKAFVLALDMDPMQIRIADMIARSPDDEKEDRTGIKIAYMDEGSIYIEPFDKDAINDIRYF